MKASKKRPPQVWSLERKPIIGDLFTLKEWLECVRRGGFIDYDGYGHALRFNFEAAMYEVAHAFIAKPSQVVRGKLKKIPSGTTHIRWFNR